MGNMRFFLAFGIFGLSLCAMAGNVTIEGEDGVVVERFEYEILEVFPDGSVNIVLDEVPPSRPANPKPANPKPANPKPAAPKPAAPNNCPSPPPGLEEKPLPSGRFSLTFTPDKSSYALKFSGKAVDKLAMVWADIATDSEHTQLMYTVSRCAGDFNRDNKPMRCSGFNYTFTMYLSPNNNVSYACNIDANSIYFLNIKDGNTKERRAHKAVFETANFR